MKPAGFALVATVSMMVLLTLICMGMLGLATVEQRSDNILNQYNQTARANARMALMIALGELQRASGPDQRVTATASLLGHSSNSYTSATTAVDGKRHWLGVWDTRYDANGDGVIDSGDMADTDADGVADAVLPYDPSDPHNKTFVRWLVSGNQAAVDSMADVATATAAGDVVIFDGVDEAATVKVPKVEVSTDSTSFITRRFYQCKSIYTRIRSI